ncbi:MAG: DUF6048 family protein [Bacteroidota bacterium]
MCGYFFRVWLVMLPMAIFGQSVKEAPDTIRTPKFTGIRFGMETIGFIKSRTGGSFSGNEFMVDTDIGKYYLVTEFGNWSRNLSITDGSYTNDGRYVRVGVDVNFLKKDPDRNMFFLGARYGRAFYDERVTYLNKSEFGDQEKTAVNAGIRSGWVELTTGIRVKVWKIIWVGYTARMKFAPGVPSASPLAPYDIPGYGLTFKKPWWGFSYYLMVRVPFKKDK